MMNATESAYGQPQQLVQNQNLKQAETKAKKSIANRYGTSGTNYQQHLSSQQHYLSDEGVGRPQYPQPSDGLNNESAENYI